MRPIFILLHDSFFPSKAVEAASVLAKKFKQESKFLRIRESKGSNFDTNGQNIQAEEVSENELGSFTESQDASMLVFEIPEVASGSYIQHLLNICRSLRMPYLFVKASQPATFSNLLVPISFLEEEREKAPFASAFGRQFGSKITLLKANDYGSKAQRNTDAIRTLLDSFALTYTEGKGQKDSFGIEQEAVLSANSRSADLVIASASREYGLDDLIFGPKERHLLKKTTVPLLLINPRGDLYALCD